MMKRLEVVCFLLVTSWFIHSPPVSASARNRIIKPGRSVGKIRLGARRTAVHKLLSNPSKTTQRRDRLLEEMWLRSKRTWRRRDKAFDSLWLRSKTILEREATDKIKIIYRTGKVIQIEVTSPEFTTRTGISINSEFDEIVKRFHVQSPGNHLLGDNYCYRIGYNSQACVSFLEDVQHGITFKQHPTINWQTPFQFEAIAVHRPGRRPIPDEGFIVFRIGNGAWIKVKQ